MSIIINSFRLEFKLILMYIFLLSFLVSCTSNKKALYLYKDFEKFKPKTIAILPIENIQIAGNDSKTLKKYILDAIKSRGYTIIDIQSNNKILTESNIKFESIIEDKMVIKKICEEFNADALFISKLIMYKSTFSGVNQLVINFIIMNKDGIAIWKDNIGMNSMSLGSAALLDLMLPPIQKWITNSINTVPKY